MRPFRDFNKSCSQCDKPPYRDSGLCPDHDPREDGFDAEDQQVLDELHACRAALFAWGKALARYSEAVAKGDDNAAFTAAVVERNRCHDNARALANVVYAYANESLEAT